MVPRKPVSVHVLQGTFRDDAHKEGLTGHKLTEVPPAPEDLHKDAWQHWRECSQWLISLGVFTETELPAVRVWAETMREIKLAESDMETGGRYQTSLSTQIESMRPCVKRHDILTDRLVRLFRKFGFTPVDRVGIDASPSGDHASNVSSRKRGG